VWGGNRAINTGVTLAGLDTWVYAKPSKSSSGTGMGSDAASDAGAVPGESGGGDIHYLSSCMSGRISRMLVADVAGHGAAVDQAAVALRDLMRRYVNFLDQSRFVENLNVQFGHDNRSGSFATALVATYWVPSSTLVATNAGHPPPLIRRAATGTWEYLASEGSNSSPRSSPANLPLGVLEPTTYDQFSVKLDEDDLVLIYTDSLLEARDRDGRLVGSQGLLRILGGIDPADPAGFIPLLLEALAVEQNSEEFADDVTCLLIRRNAVRPKSGIVYLARGLRAVASQMLGAMRGGSTPVSRPEMSLRTLGAAFKGLGGTDRRSRP
ncbi:MAG TPA: PP2C family protein-serine/threonine phosphatase, partial [Phycisphaerales bacterium]|nr:PP2C family protein-serine/threonine phosphatase [Phycisphaerales bacterium]